MSSQYDKDIADSVKWLVDGSIRIARQGMAQSEYASAIMDKALVLSACATLPGDMPLRIRCTPNVFNFRA